MKKQIRFLYRYLIVTGRWRRLFNRQSLLVILAALAFLVTLGMTGPSRADREMPQRPAGMLLAAEMQQATPQPADASGVLSPTPTFTPFPPEFLTNSDQTIGITVAGAALVLIVIVGSLMVLPRGRGGKRGKRED
jgi:hypothetical protein